MGRRSRVFCKHVLQKKGRFIDYCDLIDELIMLKCQGVKKKYRQRLRYYARIQQLFIDDFGISRYPEERMNILYQLIKMRIDLSTLTLYSNQCAHDEWDQHCIFRSGKTYCTEFQNTPSGV